MEVLGDRLGGDAADLEQRLAANQRRGAAPVGGAVAVLAGTDDAVEERLLVAADHVVLDRVVVEEVVRALHQRHALVVEVTDHRVERVGHRHVVGVEHQHQLSVCAPQRRVDVARLGVGAVGPGQVAGACHLRQLLHLRPPAVVEQPGRVRIGEGAAAGQGRRDHLGRLVIGADVDVDRVSRRRRRPCDRRARPGEPRQHAERPEPVYLRHQQHREGDRARAFAAPADPPGQVADAPEQRGDRERAQQHRAAIEELPEPCLLVALHPASSARSMPPLSSA